MTKAPGSRSGPSPVSAAAAWEKPDAGFAAAAVFTVLAFAVTLTWPTIRLRLSGLPVWGGSALDAVVLLAPLAAGAVVVARVGGPNIARALGLQIRPLDLLWGLSLGLLARAGIELLFPTAGSLVPPFATSDADRVATVVAVALTAAVLAPIAEELFFRGALQRVLAARLTGRHGAAVSVVVSTLIFVLLHAAPYGVQAPPTVLLPPALVGLGAGAIVARTGRLGGAIALHVAFNAVEVILLAS